MKGSVLEAKETDDFLVTIVVPVYNVEKYLSKCIDSIIHQTYKKIEIILVDDGSTDSSGKICDDYKKADNRIKVIHKKNAGVSSARNIGIDEANGEFICFVDSDDYLSNNYVEYMLGLNKKTNADFCLSKRCYSTQKDLELTDKTDNVKVLNSIEATELLLSQEIFIGCWNKIYKLDLLRNNNIRFCESLYYGEGLKFIVNTAQVADKIGVGTERVYYYRINNMHSATKKFNLEKYKNGEKSLNMIKSELIKYDNSVEHQLNTHYCFFYFNALFDIIKNKKKSEFSKEYDVYRNKFKQYAYIVLKYQELKPKQKIKIRLMLRFPNLLVKIVSYIQKRKVESSV